MATHSSILSWRIPWTEDILGLQRVRHNQVTFTSLDFIRTLSHLAFFWELRAVSSWYYFPTPVTCPKLFTAYILYRCPMVTIKRHKQKVPASYHKLLFCILCLGIRQSNQGSPDSGGACSCIQTVTGGQLIWAPFLPCDSRPPVGPESQPGLIFLKRQVEHMGPQEVWAHI